MLVEGSGTQTAVIGTEHTLHGPDTDDKVFVLKVDTALLVNGEEVELRIYDTVLSGGTERLVNLAVYKHGQGEAIKFSLPYPCTEGFKATLKQTVGTGRNFPWAVLSL